jgi:uncharacterized protein (TIGR02145 family)
MIQQRIFTLLTILFFTQSGSSQSIGSFTDSRDGQTYKTISLKNGSKGTTFTWMAQNLNYKMQGSYAYDDKESNRKEMGLLYNWEAAKKGCPSGWHLATDREWSVLVAHFGGTDKAGGALKSTTGWIGDGNGTNSSGFNGLPGGQRKYDGHYDNLSRLGSWWSSTPTGIGDADNVWEWNLHWGGPSSDMPLKLKVFRFAAGISGGLSVRCVRD